MRHLVLTLLLPVFLAACATPKTITEIQSEQVDALMGTAATAIARGDHQALGPDIRAAVARHTGPQRVEALFAKNPKGRDLFLTYLEKHTGPASAVGSPQDAVSMADLLKQMRGADLLKAEEAARLQQRLSDSAAEGNLSGSLPFTLLDGAAFQALQTPPHKAKMLQRSVAAVKARDRRSAELKAVLDYAATLQPQSPQYQDVAAALASINFRRSELDAIAPAFPDLVAEQRKRLFVTARFVMKGGDRLLEDDIKTVLKRKLRGVEVASDGTPPVSISVERVRHEENRMPERRQTITYAQHEVNLIAAALLMPRNASYQYDVTTSGASIDYGYVVAVEGLNLPRYEKVVRGTLTSEGTQCANARIHNVFGGVTSAGFVANDDMARRCSSGSARSLEDLRSTIFEEVVNAVAESAQIKPIASADD
jgi:hypothetical protein